MEAFLMAIIYQAWVEEGLSSHRDYAKQYHEESYFFTQH